MEIFLLPPKLQRRGLVFKRKLVTMERVWWVTMEHVWWVTMIESEGLLICVYEWVTLVYGSYEHVPISYGVVTLLKANGYCRLWWCFNKIDDNLNDCAWYMGHTSMSQFHTGLGRFLTAACYCRKWWRINKIDYDFHCWAWYKGHTSMFQFHTG